MKRQEVRLALEERLRRPLPDPTWSYLVDKGYIEDYEVSACSLEDLAKEARQILEAAGTTVPRRRRRERLDFKPTQKSGRSRIISRAVSKIVANDLESELAGFVVEVLGEQWLNDDQVAKWIRDREATGVWLTIPIADDPLEALRLYSNSWALTGELHPPLIVSHLKYMDTDQRALPFIGVDGTEEFANVGPEGDLDELWHLSRSFASGVGWSQSQAVGFILTGHAPSIPVAAASITSRRITSLTRINITIDPAWTPVQVANFYRRVRRQVVSGRVRALTEKHLALAEFALESPKFATAKEQMEAWNLDHADKPGWLYRQAFTFRRDLSKALERVVMPKFDIPTEATEEEFDD